MSSEMSSQNVSGLSLEKRKHEEDDEETVFKTDLPRRHCQGVKETIGADQQVPEVTAELGTRLAPVRPRISLTPDPSPKGEGRI